MPTAIKFYGFFVATEHTKPYRLKHFREINDMLAKKRKDVQKRYKEYDGCYFGYYAQWFFFVLEFSIFAYVIVMMVGKWFNWF